MSFRAFFPETCGIKNNLSTSFPQFVDNVMLIFEIVERVFHMIQGLYLVDFLKKRHQYLVLLKITIFRAFYGQNYPIQKSGFLLDL